MSITLVIHAPPAPHARLERDALLTEQAQRELTAAGQAPLTDLIDAVEMANAEWWQALARLHGHSLTEIARDLEIPLP